MLIPTRATKFPAVAVTCAVKADSPYAGEARCNLEMDINSIQLGKLQSEKLGWVSVVAPVPGTVSGEWYFLPTGLERSHMLSGCSYQHLLCPSEVLRKLPSPDHHFKLDYFPPSSSPCFQTVGNTHGTCLTILTI